MAVDPVATRRPRAGVEQWRNPRNGFVVTQLHYTADPNKRSPEWKATVGRNMPPRAWRREYEIDWTSPEGDPVIPEYESRVHCREFRWDPTLRMLRFWDFGFDSPAILFCQLTTWGQLRIRRELCPFNCTLAQLADGAKAITLELAGTFSLAGTQGYTDRFLDVGGADDGAAFGKLPGAQPQRVFDAGDPAGTHRYDLGSSVEVLAGQGIHIHTHRPGTEVSYEQLRARFTRSIHVPGEGNQPAIIHHPECIVLGKALQGGFYRKPTPPYAPVKIHPFKDVVDALRYGHDNLDQAAKWTEASWKTMSQNDRVDAVGRLS